MIYIFGEVTDKGVGGQFNVHVEYDRLGRVWRSNAQGHYQIYVYDLADHVTQTVSSTNSFHPGHEELGVNLADASFTELSTYFNTGTWRHELQRQNTTYDALGNVLKQSKEYTLREEGAAGKQPVTTTNQVQTVDRWGNMLTYTNALGYQTTYEYDALNHLVKQELPEVSYMDEKGIRHRIKSVNQYAYDDLGQAIAMIDANGHRVSKEYDAAGRVIAETDAKGHTRTKNYTLLGQLESSTNERGGKTTYDYDKANRLLSVTTPSTKQYYSYDEAGQLIQQKNGNNDVTTFEFDTLGNQISRQDARGYITTYEYDDAGHKISETDALHHQQTWVYDADGRLKKHTDLGKHETSYEYNTNGLLLHETSTAKKNISYYYQGDGQLVGYEDSARGEHAEYAYDAEGQMIRKTSHRAQGDKVKWIGETDFYKYDELGRLIQVRRRNPDDSDQRFPEEDKTLLSVDYDYDKAGNIRHTQVGAKYSGHQVTTSDDYYTYDENNRMTLNKGQLVNGAISITSKQGTALVYDEAGNITNAVKYEHGAQQEYKYVYNTSNQLLELDKNHHKIQTKKYDASNRVTEEYFFDAREKRSQINIMHYEHGVLKTQETLDQQDSKNSSVASYDYDEAGNITSWTININGGSGHKEGSTITHRYEYEFWDSYQQSVDTAYFSTHKGGSTRGRSVRVYDKTNGLLEQNRDEHIDGNGLSNSVDYWTSSVDGIRGREDKTGRTGYLTVAGKTIGELHLDHDGTQSLNVYGGFTPAGSQQNVQSKKLHASFQRAAGDVADGTLPEAPQDTLGTYTLQAGDTMESIALQVYGDSSLWYLIADANGISDRNATVGRDGELHIGQRLNLPPAATGQHHTNATHKVMNANQMLGNTSATTAIPTPKPPKPKHHNNFFSKMVVAIIATVATVVTAGVLGPAIGAALSALSLATSATATTIGTMALGFTAGFVGNIAGQTASAALGMQSGIDITSALITGLATAATSGLGAAFQDVKSVQDTISKIDGLSMNKYFGVTTALEQMEQNIASQSLNLMLRRHQHFDWETLAVTGVTAGVLGSSYGKKLDTKLSGVDQKTGVLSRGFKALAGRGLESIATGTHFDAFDVSAESLGSTIGGALGKNLSKSSVTDLSVDDDLMDLMLDNDPIDRYLDGGDIIFDKFLALYGQDTPKVSRPAEHKTVSPVVHVPDNTTTQSNELFIYGEELGGYVGEVIYNKSERFEGEGMLQAALIYPISLGEDITYQQSSYTFEQALNKQMKDKPQYWIGKPRKPFDAASRNQVIKCMDIDNLFSDPIKRVQFMDLQYQSGIEVKDLDILLKGKGVLDGKGETFLKAAVDNNINPIYLVAHALHESQNGISPLAKNNNFFGMGATDGNAKVAGIKFAREHGWTTPEKGIMGGAKIISAKWVNKMTNSQNTLYAMRWSPLNPGQMQYATDINWANAQTERIYKQVERMRQIDPLYQPKFIVPKYREMVKK